jgi:hypothetical protein
MAMCRSFEDDELLFRLEEERVELLVQNRKLKKKLAKRDNRIQELEEKVKELSRALGQDEVDSCSDDDEMGMGSSEQKPVDNQPHRHQVDRFRDKYVKLDPLTQHRVLNFLGQTQHYQLNSLGNAVFEGSRQDFENALPVLQSLAPSMKLKNSCYLEHEHGDMTGCAGLRAPNQWSVEFTPNEIVFPEIIEHPMMGWQMDMTPGSYSHPWGANFAI